MFIVVAYKRNLGILSLIELEGQAHLLLGLFVDSVLLLRPVFVRTMTTQKLFFCSLPNGAQFACERNGGTRPSEIYRHRSAILVPQLQTPSGSRAAYRARTTLLPEIQ